MPICFQRKIFKKPTVIIIGEVISGNLMYVVNMDNGQNIQFILNLIKHIFFYNFICLEKLM